MAEAAPAPAGPMDAPGFAGGGHPEDAKKFLGAKGKDMDKGDVAGKLLLRTGKRAAMPDKEIRDLAKNKLRMVEARKAIGKGAAERARQGDGLAKQLPGGGGAGEGRGFGGGFGGMPGGPGGAPFPLGGNGFRAAGPMFDMAQADSRLQQRFFE